MTEPARLQPLTPQDVPAMEALHARCFPLPWSAESLTRLLIGGSRPALGLWQGAGLGGFILCASVAETCDVLTLCVDPGRRRQGLGRDLMQAAMEQAAAEGASRMILEVETRNSGARGLYALLGFTAVGLRRNYYLTPEGLRDALVLARDLPAAAARAATG